MLTNEKKKGKRNERPVDGPITNDERFSSVHSDPRFAFPRKKELKVAVDDRFKGLLQDEEFKQKNIVDRYGRTLESNRSEKELKRLYLLDEERSESSDSHQEPSLRDAARGEGSVSSTDSEDHEEYEEESMEQSAMGTLEKIPVGDVTRRFALVNLDWDHLKASDLYTTLSSFTPTPGKVQSVRIYLSDFGRQKMAEEQIAGPPKDLFNSQDEGSEKQIIQTEDVEQLDMSKLRQYQLSRLRYYYAITDCDSIETAKRIYDECDGAEYESSGNFFDIRFVPNDISFDDEPKDECNELPVMYEPNSFATGALQHSKIKLTWDDDDYLRQRCVQRAFSKKDIEDMDFKAYLASSESEDENEQVRDNYISLLQQTQTPRDNEEEKPMQITFEPAMTNHETSDKVPPVDETSIQKYQRKERERRERNRPQRTVPEKKDDEPDRGFHDDFFADAQPIHQPKHGTKKTRKHPEEITDSTKIEKATNDELELLMMDEAGTDSNLKHFDLRQIQRAEKAKGKKGKHQSKRTMDDLQDDFQVDVLDPRFASLYNEHEFAIDPTNPHYKKTKTMEMLLSEKRRRRNKETKGLV